MSSIPFFVCALFCAANLTQTRAEESSVAPAAAAEADSPVYAAVEGLDFVTQARPAKDAKYYIILESASWCPPCRNEMPKIVREYPELRKAGVELIQISHDRNLETAQKWAEAEHVPFAVIAPNANKRPPSPLPWSRGIPNMHILNNKGEVLIANHPGILLPKWREYCK